VHKVLIQWAFRLANNNHSALTLDHQLRWRASNQSLSHRFLAMVVASSLPIAQAFCLASNNHSLFNLGYRLL
jgi:hypothetical protein